VRSVRHFISLALFAAVASLAVFTSRSLAQFDFEQPPIRYRHTPESNPVARLEAKLRAGELSLRADQRGSYLASVLDLLDVPLSSQTLVFSKTSLQQGRISPQTPRAVYFNDECYIAWVQDGLIEIGVMDDHLGAVFYTIRDGARNASLIRDRGGCIACHATGRTQKVPGFLVRSVYTAADGHPRDFGTTSDHRSPFSGRWGGWYVTGTHGDMRHLGNELAVDPDNEEKIDVEKGANVVSLSDRFDGRRYLTPHSDLVALMVMEHQSQMHNFLTRARYETVLALDDEDAAGDASSGNASPQRLESLSDAAKLRIEKAGDQLVEYLLLCGEDRLTTPVAGTSTFVDDFVAMGPVDSQGRSLRQFDLKTRMFVYPCSYLIYSSAFDALPQPLANYVRMRVLKVLKGEDQSEQFAHLTPVDRRAILEILTETKPQWVNGDAASAE